jgi:hypothetical protein
MDDAFRVPPRERFELKRTIPAIVFTVVALDVLKVLAVTVFARDMFEFKNVTPPILLLVVPALLTRPFRKALLVQMLPPLMSS